MNASDVQNSSKDIEKQVSKEGTSAQVYSQKEKLPEDEGRNQINFSYTKKYLYSPIKCLLSEYFTINLLF